MKAEVDPRLLRELEEAGDDGQVEAAVLLVEDSDSNTEHAKQLLDRVADSVEQQPRDVEIMSNLGTVIVKGSGKFVRELVAQDDVASASSMEAEITAL